jgi:hypothetical protein
VPSANAISPDDQAARDVAVAWINLLDAGHYRQAFEEEAPRIKSASAGRDYFVKWMQTHRVPLGQPRTRSFLKVIHIHRVLTWPDGDYEQIAFKSSFSHKAEAVELVVVTKETGRWQVGSYRLF